MAWRALAFIPVPLSRFRLQILSISLSRTAEINIEYASRRDSLGSNTGDAGNQALVCLADLAQAGQERASAAHSAEQENISLGVKSPN